MESLAKFGEVFISEVRDETAQDFLDIESGKMKSEIAMRMHNMLQQFDSNEKVMIKNLVGHMIDRTIHNCLWMFEKSMEFTITSKTDRNNPEEDIVGLSDGFAGELYSVDGWFEKFSKDLLSQNSTFH